MALRLAESLFERGGLYPVDQLERYVRAGGAASTWAGPASASTSAAPSRPPSPASSARAIPRAAPPIPPPPGTARSCDSHQGACLCAGLAPGWPPPTSGRMEAAVRDYVGGADGHVARHARRLPAPARAARPVLGPDSLQELRRHHRYAGSDETVKRFVRPLRAAEAVDLTERRFETPPGAQSQLDWGPARVYFGAQPVEVHVFVLPLGLSRRGFYRACADERLAPFLDAHEAAFEHFGGHTREPLDDRPGPSAPPAVARTGRASGLRPARRSPSIGASSRGSAGPIARRRRGRSRAE